MASSKIRLGINPIRIRFTKQAFQYEWRAKCFHNLSLGRRLGARRNVPTIRGIVEGICATCIAGGSEKNGIFWWFLYMRT
jgi:hypothetical protein